MDFKGCWRDYRGALLLFATFKFVPPNVVARLRRLGFEDAAALGAVGAILNLFLRTAAESLTLIQIAMAGLAGAMNT